MQTPFFLLYKYANTFTPESGYLVPQVLPFNFVQKICMKQGLYGIISVKRGSWRQIIITDKCGAKIFHGKQIRVCLEECCLHIYSVQSDIQFPVEISYFRKKNLFFALWLCSIEMGSHH